jgi:outer membrane lipoprotein-sorting protein
MNILRRLSLRRLLLLCALVVAIGVSATAIAFALDSGPTPPAKPLAQALHDALAGTGGGSIQGISASVQLTNHLLEGASLASGGGTGGGLASGPLLSGASGRLWIAKDGHARLELQAEQGDTEIYYDGHTLTLYDAASNTVYRYTPPQEESSSAGDGSTPHAASASGRSGSDGEAPSVATIEEAISQLSKHANVSGATPTNVAGQPAYTVRVSPKEGGSMFDGAELSFDASNGVPLRAAIYSTTTSSPVIELAASEISYGPVADSVFAFTPPAGAKIEEVDLPDDGAAAGSRPAGDGDGDGEKPTVTTHGHGPSTIAVLASSRYGDTKVKSNSAGAGGEALEGLPKVTIDGASASELRTELGTVLTFERSGIRYVLAGSVPPAAIEELARGL